MNIYCWYKKFIILLKSLKLIFHSCNTHLHVHLCSYKDSLIFYTADNQMKAVIEMFVWIFAYKFWYLNLILLQTKVNNKILIMQSMIVFILFSCYSNNLKRRAEEVSIPTSGSIKLNTLYIFTLCLNYFSWLIILLFNNIQRSK